jgi:hypothetical protein
MYRSEGGEADRCAEKSARPQLRVHLAHRNKAARAG